MCPDGDRLVACWVTLGDCLLPPSRVQALLLSGKEPSGDEDVDVNREMKRMSQRRGGTVEADDDPAAFIPPVTERRPRAIGPELSLPGRIVEFFREVRSELRQVAWPTRQEVANSAMVVIIVLVLLGSLIFLLNYAFTHAVLKLLTA